MKLYIILMVAFALWMMLAGIAHSRALNARRESSPVKNEIRLIFAETVSGKAAELKHSLRLEQHGPGVCLCCTACRFCKWIMVEERGQKKNKRICVTQHTPQCCDSCRNMA